MPSADVLIIGAGVAGLHAADHLINAGRTVIILEGRDRIGGRLLSPNLGDGYFDLGASWFWANEPLVNAIVHDESLEPFAQHLAGDALFQTDEGVQRLAGNQLDAPSGRLRRGTHSIPQALHARLPDRTVRLSEQVTSVDFGDDLATIRTADARYTAAHVVVALPPALAVSSIDFNGQLDPNFERLASITPVWMGGSAKVVAHYDRPFWRDTGLAGSAFSYVGPLGELHDMSGPDGTPAAIFGFARPKPGEPSPTREGVLAQLTTLFGPAAAEPVELFIQDWRAESLTSPPNVAELSSYQLFGHDEYQTPGAGGRLHWCSTETSQAAPGHIEGALWASLRTANTILAN